MSGSYRTYDTEANSQESREHTILQDLNPMIVLQMSRKIRETISFSTSNSM